MEKTAIEEIEAIIYGWTMEGDSEDKYELCRAFIFNIAKEIHSKYEKRITPPPTQPLNNLKEVI